MSKPTLTKSKILNILLKHTTMYLLIIVVLVMGGSAQGGEENEKNTWDNIVQEAHDYDPAYAISDGDVSRDKAISLYRKAIREHSDNLSNIKLKHRIAQLYAFYGDPRKNVWPNGYLAAKEFRELIEQYPITELDCLQSHIGLGGINVMRGSMKEAVKYYRKVLDFNPEDNSELIENFSREKMAEYSKVVESARLTSVNTIAYASIRLSPQYFFDQMKYIIDKYPETDVARKAQEHCDRKAEQMANLEYILEDSIKELALSPTNNQSKATLNKNSYRDLQINSSKIASDGTLAREKQHHLSTTEKPERLFANNNISNKFNTKTEETFIEKSSHIVSLPKTSYKMLYLMIGTFFLILVAVSVFKYRTQINKVLFRKEGEI